jgi:hypothetical protein
MDILLSKAGATNEVAAISRGLENRSIADPVVSSDCADSGPVEITASLLQLFT